MLLFAAFWVNNFVFISVGGNMQDLVNRLESAEKLTRQLLVRL